MISLTLVFYLFVIIAGVIGLMRGWAKELLVVFSVILALFVISVFQRYIGIYQRLTLDPVTQFWTRSIIVLALAFFGYQTPNIKIFEAGARREQVRDAVLGAGVGALNGYLIVGSVWSFLAKAGYENFSRVLQAPEPNSELALRAAELLTKMPPEYFLDKPENVAIAIAIAFTFVVVVYI